MATPPREWRRIRKTSRSSFRALTTQGYRSSQVRKRPGVMPVPTPLCSCRVPSRARPRQTPPSEASRTSRESASDILRMSDARLRESAVARGSSTVAMRRPSKPVTRVRFPSPAQRTLLHPRSSDRRRSWLASPLLRLYESDAIAVRILEDRVAHCCSPCGCSSRSAADRAAERSRRPSSGWAR